MAKARGDRLVTKMDYRRNPMAIDARNLQPQTPALRNAMAYYPGHPDYIPPRPPTYQERHRMANGQNPGNANFIYGVDDKDENGNPFPEGYTGRVPARNPMQAWADAEQVVRVGQAADSWKQAQQAWADAESRLGTSGQARGMDRLYGNQGGPQSVNPQNQDVLDRAAAALEAVKQDRLNPMHGGQQGFAAPGQNAAVQGSPGLQGIVDGVGRGLYGAATSLSRFLQSNAGRGRQPMNGGAQAYAAPGANGPQTPYDGPNAARPSNPPAQYYTGPPENVRPERIRDLQDSQGFRFAGRADTRAVPNLADALNDPPMYPPQNEYAPDGRGPIPQSVASQAPSYYEQQGAGMDVESIRMRELAGRIDGLRRQSQQDNPMRPIPGGDPEIAAMQAEIDRGTRQQNIMFEPGATSSTGARRNFRQIQPEDLNGTTAGTVNGYNGNVGYAADPNRASAERSIASSQANAQRLAEGGAAADPTNGRGRFGGAYGAGLDADATALAEGRAVRTADGKVVYFTGTQESARQAQTAGKTEREALRNRDNPAATEEERDRRARADAAKAERAAKHDAFKQANGGMNYRQYDRMTGGSNGNNALTMKAVREGRLSPAEANYRMQIRAEKALRRSGNPVPAGTSQAGRLFPDMMPKQSGNTSSAQNPMALTFAGMTRESSPTADSLSAATDLAVATVNGVTGPDGKVVKPPSEFAKQLKERGYSPEDDTGMALPNTHVQEVLQKGNKLTPGDVRDLRNIAFSSRERTKGDTEWWGGAKAPFENIGTGPFERNPEYQKNLQDMYTKLADMPETASDAEFQAWAVEMEDLVNRWRL